MYSPPAPAMVNPLPVTVTTAAAMGSDGSTGALDEPPGFVVAVGRGVAEADGVADTVGRGVEVS